MTSEEAFLQDICEHPEDDTPRLIFADWLDEHDNPDRAEFIRLQCELAGRGDSDPVIQRLKPRERQLLELHGTQWLGGLRDLGLILDPTPPPHPWMPVPFNHVARFERGFVEKVSLPYTDFVLRAETLFEAAPTIRSVRLVRTGGNLPSTSEDVILLADSAELGRLLTLDLTRLFIGDDRVALIVASPNLYRLRRLELGLSSVGGTRTVMAVARNRGLAGLSHLDLSSLGVHALTIHDLLWADHLSNLRSLNLSRNGIDTEGARYLACAERLASLRSLDLEYNRINDYGARALAASPHLGNLTTLNLAHNPLGQDGRSLLHERFGSALSIS